MSKYTVRYTYRLPGARRTWEFNTRDKQQAYRKARQYAEHGQLVGLFRQVGGGQWEELDVPGVREGAER